MNLWINGSMIRDVYIVKEASFFATPVVLPDAIAKKLVKFEEDKQEVRRYLRGYVQMTEASNEDPTTLEVPACLQDAAKSGSKPKKKATAPRSKSKSQTKRKVIQSKPAMSLLKQESSG